ncbi:cobalt ECF transporter T component CbiQ [Tumebacillus algifaecis]|uniref:Cobalt ECF transporter T component CbiQ n=1 Tax=Tumebacillus algifaecis TaxID=1214604 RepID=A0A223CWL8_9BACL|nr:cobalt ECF transporter T component CbiQ [Tumebacillus algifaecis]ASS73700.1 cobalt ECF transporter T component CbiQ [Tumebacillus algifaecis]
MIRLIDTLSYSNAFRSVSPLWKCGFAAALFVLAISSHPLVQLLIAVWIIVWTVRYARIPFRSFLLLFAVSCLFFVAGSPALLLEIGSESDFLKHNGMMFIPLFADTGLYITDSGLLRAGELFMRIAACLSCMFFLILTTPFTELLQVLKRLRVPSLVLELMLIMYRFIFLLADTAHDINVAQRARGGYVGFSRSLHDLAHLVVHLFAKTMHQYRGLSHGLLSRGFADEISLAPYQAKPVPFRYRLESVLGLLVLICLEVWI